jgi:signal transduction histidine kinase
VETHAHEGGAQIAVTDRGPGLDSQHTGDVFQSRFTTKPTGMGFGLSIVRAIAEMHGGRVAYESVQPQGARFTVWLPALEP